jgi:hypothetical protein
MGIYVIQLLWQSAEEYMSEAKRSVREEDNSD